MRKWLWLIMLAAPHLWAQVSSPSIVSVSATPSGACTAGLPNRQVISTGMQYSCQSGTWGAIGGGGGGNPGGSNTQVQFNDSTAFNGAASLTYTKSTGTVGGLGGVYIDPSSTPLAQPTITSVTPQTAGGGVTYTYVLQALFNNLSTQGSTAVTTTDGENDLSVASQGNVVVWPTQTGATSCLLYRTAAGGSTTNTTGVIATISTPGCGTGYTDVGAAGDGGYSAFTNQTGELGGNNFWFGPAEYLFDPNAQGFYNSGQPPNTVAELNSINSFYALSQSDSGITEAGQFLAFGRHAAGAWGIVSSGQVEPSSGETSPTAQGIQSFVYNNGSGTLTEADAFRVNGISNYGGGNIDNAYGFECSGGISGTSITRAACLHINESGPNLYSILQEGSAPNLFAAPTTFSAGVNTGNSSNTDLAGILTASGGTASYSFTGTHATAPVCIVQDDTTLASLLTKTVSTTTLTVTTTGATDSVSYICVGKN